MLKSFLAAVASVKRFLVSRMRDFSLCFLSQQCNNRDFLLLNPQLYRQVQQNNALQQVHLGLFGSSETFFLMFLFKVPAGTVSWLDMLYGWFANS